MYLIELALVLTVVYLAPALAIRPTLAARPTLALAIPFISVAVVVCLQALLSSLGLFNPAVVRACTGVLALTAAARISMKVHADQYQCAWTDNSRLLALINVSLCLYFGASIFLHGFDRDDEIYSWNLWAIQYFLGEKIDFYYTAAPYPQLFPRLLSWCYMLLGNYDDQTAVKTALIIFPFTIYSTWALASDGRQKKFLLLHLVLALLIVREMHLKEFFDDGLPDSLVASAIVASIFFLQRYRENRSSRMDLWLCVLCACLGILTKQPALVWGIFSLPVILLIDCSRGRDTVRAFLPALLPALVATAWMLTEGRDFTDNTGVLSRSFAGRDLWQQMVFSLDRYIVHRPMTALLLCLAVVSVVRARRGLAVLLLFVLPSMISWFLFAAYDLRAGVPALVVLGYLVARGNYCLGRKQAGDVVDTGAGPGKLAWVCGLLLLAVSVDNLVADIGKYRDKHPGYAPGNAVQNNLYTMFAADAPVIDREIFQREDARLWTPSNYDYGLFYGRVDVVRPAYGAGGYGVRDVVDDLRAKDANLASDGGQVSYGPGGGLLKQLVERDCPRLFSKIAGPDNAYAISVYRLDTALLHSTYCEP